jgi:hypothetical protein
VKRALATILITVLALGVSESHAIQSTGVLPTFENFYAPVDSSDCPNGILKLTRTDKRPFIEFDNFALTVSNRNNKVLGSSIFETFATEDSPSELLLPVRICGDDPNYLGSNEFYVLQVKFISADRKFGQEFSITFQLIPVDEKAKAAYLVRKNCNSSGVGYEPYFINWNVERAPKVKVGGKFTVTGTLYRFGYPADFERITIVKSVLRPESSKVIVADVETDINGKFNISWKIENKNYPLYLFTVEERIRPVGPYFGTFAKMSVPIFIDCSKTCSYKRMEQIYAPWEGLPKKSAGQCAVLKHEYSLVAAKSAISLSGAGDNDRNRWLLALSILRTSISDPTTTASKLTSVFVNDPGASTSYSNYKSTGGGTVWVRGHMRNGKYVSGYSRRKG